MSADGTYVHPGDWLWAWSIMVRERVWCRKDRWRRLLRMPERMHLRDPRPREPHKGLHGTRARDEGLLMGKEIGLPLLRRRRRYEWAQEWAWRVTARLDLRRTPPSKALT